MQSIPTAILSPTINIGQTPVFIIAPTIQQGSLLAFLLSKNVDVPTKYARIFDTINHHNNYFTNPRIDITLQKTQQSKFLNRKEDFAKVKLQFEEHQDNAKLWGLLCNYEQFFELALYEISQNAYYIFVYEEPVESLAYYYDKTLTFIREQTESCFLVYEKTLSHNSAYLLSLLPFRYKSLSKCYFHQDNAQRKFAGNTFDSGTKFSQLRHVLLKNDLLFKTQSLFLGDRICFVFYYKDASFKDALLSKLYSIQNVWLQVPEIHLICTQNAKVELYSILTLESLTHLQIRYWVGDNIAAQLNQISHYSEKEYLFFDDLTLQINLSVSFKYLEENNYEPDLIFYTTATTGELIESSVSIVDIIASPNVEHALICRRSLWSEVSGFDEHLETSIFLWDFVIRVAENKVAMVSSISALMIQKIQLSQNDNIQDTEAYHKVLAKHRTLLETHLDELVHILSNRYFLPQKQINKLHEKIADIQSLLQHSKGELKAVTDLSRMLQHRINLLENRWYYKLGKKISRLKKIFFKKNTKGTSRLKKIIHFVSFTFSKAGLFLLRKMSKRALKKMYLIAEDRPVQIIYLDEKRDDNQINTYDDWIKLRQNKQNISSLFQQQKRTFTAMPKISIVMPVYNPPLQYLKEALESVLAQDYTNWELCIADDCSPNEKVQKLLKAYSMKDNRIKVEFRNENGHISASSNSALTLATGDFILLMDHDDLLSLDCLFEVVKHINRYPEHDIIYSDEDKISEHNIHSMPHFKPDWAPHSLLSRNYFGHVVVIRKKIIDQIGGFRIGFEGSQDYDLILRATEISQSIGHIPKVLYHWRNHSMSAAQSEDVKPYAYIAAKKALEEALQRRKTPGKVSYLSGLRGYRVHYDLQKNAMVSIIIPTKDHAQLLSNTIESIITLTSYKNYEIVVLNNNSTTVEFENLINKYTQQYPNQFRCIKATFPFNFAKLMNIGVNTAKGEYVLLLNNDVEVIEHDWLSNMLSYAQLKHTGAVGVKLLYPDDLIQHAGVIVGLGGVAGHVFVNAFKDDPGYFNYVQSVNNFSAVTAACLMVKKSLYHEVGGMNEDLEVEYNDVDFCLRLLNAGYYNVYLPQVELYHYESATRGHPHQSRSSWERHLREIQIFKSLWQKYIDRDPFYNPNLNLGVHDFSLNFSAPINTTD